MRRLAACLLVILAFMLAVAPGGWAGEVAFPQLDLSAWDGRGESIPEPALTGEDAEATLDRQGGSRFVFRFDPDAARRAVLDELRDQIRAHLRGIRTGYFGLTVRDGGVELFLNDRADGDRVLARSARTSPPSPVAPEDRVDVFDLSYGRIRVASSEAMFADRQRVEMRAALERYERHVRVYSPSAQARLIGLDHLLLLAPGVVDPSRVLGIMDKRAALSIRLIETVDRDEADGARPGAAPSVLPLEGRLPPEPGNRPIFGAATVADVAAILDPATSAPIVVFRLRAADAYRLAEVTGENAGRTLGFALDDRVFVRAIIRESIPSGRAKLTGPLTAKQAQEIATYLRVGIFGQFLTTVKQTAVARPAEGTK